jgi:signal peptidase II
MSSDDAVVDAEELPPRRGLLLILITVVVLTADVLTKIAVVSALEGEKPVRLLGGLVYLQLVRNSGAAFSMATGMTWVLTLIAVAVVGAIVWIMPKLRSVGWAIGLSLVLAGALGNLTDRFFRAPGPLRGHVVDFVSLFAPNGDVWPVFNVADSAIVVGGCLIVVMALLGREYDGRSTRNLSKAEPS